MGRAKSSSHESSLSIIPKATAGTFFEMLNPHSTEPVPKNHWLKERLHNGMYDVWVCSLS